MELLRAGRAGRLVRLAAAIGAVSPVASGSSRTDERATTGNGVTLAVPGRSNATPSVATDDDLVAIVWSASLASGTTDIFLAVSHDGGRTFGAPVRVNDVDGDARVNGEQPPRVTIHPSNPPTITVVWTTKGAAGTKLVQARSNNGGRSFARATTVPGGDAAGNCGWHATAATRHAATRSAKASAERQEPCLLSGSIIASSRSRTAWSRPHITDMAV